MIICTGSHYNITNDKFCQKKSLTWKILNFSKSRCRYPGKFLKLPTIQRLFFFAHNLCVSGPILISKVSFCRNMNTLLHDAGLDSYGDI